MAQRNDTQGGAGGYWGYNGTGQKVWISQKANVTAPTATPVTQRQKEQEYQKQLMQQQGYNPQMAVALPKLPSMAQAAIGAMSNNNKPKTATQMMDNTRMTPWAYYNNYPMGTGRNLLPEDYSNLYGRPQAQQYGARSAMDTSYPAGVDAESAINYLPDNYAYLTPESVANMPLWNGSSSEGGATGTATGDEYIPTWGGGGYSMRDYYRDNGLINWRI